MSESSIRLACCGERDAAALRDREWLVTNGLGGYASGTVLGVPTRRYHGLFVPNLAQPEGRHLMIGRYDEELITGGTRALLGGADLEEGHHGERRGRRPPRVHARRARADVAL